MERVDDASSLAAMQLATDRLGRSVGGSTGTNLCGAWLIAPRCWASARPGSVVTLICDGGERYARATTTPGGWPHRLDLAPYLEVLDRAWTTGEWTG